MTNQNLKITPKGDLTRRRIIETTARLMADKGPDSVSMREVAGKLKLTKPVLYYYFKNKEELIQEAFKEGTRELRDFLKQKWASDAPLEEKITTLFSKHLDLLKKLPDAPRCVLKIISSPAHSFMNRLHSEMKRENRLALRNMLLRAVKNGEIGRNHVNDMIHLIEGSLVLFLVEANEVAVPDRDKKLPMRLASMICAGAKSLKVLAVAFLLQAVFFLRGATAAPLEMSLNGAVEAALKNNTTVVTAQETHEMYQARIKEYYGSVYPQLSAGAQYTRNIEKSTYFLGDMQVKVGLNNSYTGSLDLNQVLWSGGKVHAGIKMARTYSDASEEQLKIARNGVTKTVKQLYYSVLLSSAMVGIQNDTLDLARQHLDTIKAQYRQGLSSDLAVSRQTVEVSNSEPALTQARNLYEEGLLDLINLLGLDPEQEIVLIDDLSAPSDVFGDINEFYRTALSSRPEYRNMKYQRDLYRQMVVVEKAGHYPSLNAVASRQFQGQSDSGFPGAGDRSWSLSAGLNLSMPLFSGGATASRVKQADIQADIAEINLKEMERAIKIEVKKAWLAMKEASERLKSQTAAVETARKTLTSTEVRFKNGLASQLEINDASLALNKSRSLYIQALHDTCSADAELKWTLGE
jgi:outer membrane protein